MYRYTIYTQYFDNLKGIVAEFFPKGFTIQKQIGYDHLGECEESASIIVLINSNKHILTETLCSAIKRINKQKTVLLTIEEIQGRFI